jgi:isopenicillin-N N-acyltransferase-like protein
MTSDDQTPPVPLIHVAGSDQERGKSYGQQAGDRISAGLDIYREAFARVGMAWDEACRIAARFREKVEAYDPSMYREICAIAQGAEQPVEAIIILNARTEIIFWRDNELDAAVKPDGPQEGCTSALALPGVTADSHMLHGQNWDWNPRCATSSVVLRIENADGPDILTFVEAGQLARHGMNSAGIALTVNGLQCDLDCGNVGTPNPLMRRRLLLSDTLAGAIDSVLNADISFSHSLSISHRGGSAVTLETTPAQSYWLQPDEGFLVHANHFKCPVARSKLTDIGLQRCPESLYRDQRVTEAMRTASGDITLDTFKAAFADTFGSPDAVLRTPKARPGGNLSGTVATILMDTTAGKMWVAPSPYKGIHFTEYSLDY